MAVQRVKCPTCEREIDWLQSPFRPFCSERCKLIDLGAWLAEKHSIPGEPAPDDAPDRTSAPQDGDPQRRLS
ncbi:MAG TPA: DNA gyrase inhibitor YacG [Steroidobacteraceae bacterium]|jgi:hypothetical protein|nr:DNA gyrase inhibitor YacG [Steroidobacteraceae bacterium]